MQGPGFNALGGDVQTMRQQQHFCGGGKCAPMVNRSPLLLPRISNSARNIFPNRHNGGLGNKFQNVPGIGFVPSSHRRIGRAQRGKSGDVTNTLMKHPSSGNRTRGMVGSQVSLSENAVSLINNSRNF